MKKLKSFLFTTLILLMTCCCFLFTGCSATGTYKFDSLKYNDGDNVFTAEVGDKFEGVELTKDTFILIIEKDTFILRAFFTYTDGDTETKIMVGKCVKGYKKEIYFVVEDDEPLIATKNGNKISFEFEEVKFTLKKTI